MDSSLAAALSAPEIKKLVNDAAYKYLIKAILPHSELDDVRQELWLRLVVSVDKSIRSVDRWELSQEQHFETPLA